MSKIRRAAPSFFGEQEPQTSSSSAQGSTTNFIGYYKPNVGIKAVTPSAKVAFKGRILPTFNWDLDTADLAFKASTSSYRREDWDYQTSGNNPLLSEFCQEVMCYSFLGRSKNKLVSPQTRRKLEYEYATAEDLADPIEDVRKHIQQHHPELLNLIQKEGDEYPLLPEVASRAFVNMWGMRSGETTPYNAVVDVSGSAFYDLQDQLNFPSENNDGRDPNWPQYLLGDITDKETGIVTLVRLITEVPQRKRFNGFVFQTDGSGRRNTLEGVRERSVNEQILRDRFFMYGPDHVFKILPYQEIVDFLIDDGAVPIDILKAACEYMANVSGKDFTNPTHVLPPAPKQELYEDPFAEESKEEKKQTPAQESPPRPVPPKREEHPEEKVEESKFFAADKEATGDAVKLKFSEIQKMIDSGKDPSVYDGSAWLYGDSLEKLGFKLPPKEEEPPPPPPPVRKEKRPEVKSEEITAAYIAPSLDEEVPEEPKEEPKEEESSEVSPEDLEWYNSMSKNLNGPEMSAQDVTRWMDIDTKLNK